jgi:tetratricopeptide (TPR) repeat protein
MSSKRLLSVAKDIIRQAATIGLDEAGTRICGPTAWGYFKKILAPVVDRLKHQYPKLFLVGEEEAAKKAVDALSKDRELQALLLDGFSKLDRGQKDITALLARQDKTLKGLGNRIDQGFKEAAKRGEINVNVILQKLDKLELQLKGAGAFAAVPSNLSELPISKISNRAWGNLKESLDWIASRDAEKASLRISQARGLLDAGLKREPKNSVLLTLMGYTEKNQVQVSLIQGDQDTAVTALAEASKYFAQALKYNPSDVGALNGMANVYLFAHDYDRAIKLGELIIQIEPNYAEAAWDLSIAIEQRLKEVGHQSALIDKLISVYQRLEVLMPKHGFPASNLAYVQNQLAKWQQLKET